MSRKATISEPELAPVSVDSSNASERQTVKKTALDWMGALGTVDAHFVSADILYGWSKQAYHFQAKPFLLSQADYELAIAAALKFPTAKPHKPAIAPVLGDKFDNFKPLKAN